MDSPSVQSKSYQKVYMKCCKDHHNNYNYNYNHYHNNYNYNNNNHNKHSNLVPKT